MRFPLRILQVFLYLTCATGISVTIREGERLMNVGDRYDLVGEVMRARSICSIRRATNGWGERPTVG